MAKVLITDGLWRKTVVAIRNLGKLNLQITVTGDSHFTSGFYSRYCTKKLLTVNAKTNPQEFYQQIITELKKTKYEVLIPMEDATIAALLPHRQEIEKYTKFPLPETSAYKIAANKAATLKLAASLNIDIPQTYYTSTKFNPEDVPLPAIIKPTVGSGSRGLAYINTTEELKSKITEFKKLNIEAVIQERLPQEGQEVGVNLLFNHQHHAVASFTYKRLRDFPVNGGPSTLRESTHDPELLKTATKLLQKLNWEGVAMVEFKRDPRDGKTKLMEINPRFWGSLALPIAAGVNFPQLLYQLETSHQPTPISDYPAGVRCRWLIPGDILHFITNPNRFSLKPSFFNFFAKNTFYDDFDQSDPIGNIAVIACNLIQSFNPRMWKMAFFRAKSK